MYGINEWMDKAVKAYRKLFKKTLRPIKLNNQQRGNQMQWLKNQLEKQVNSIVDTNDLTDLQVWGCCFGSGVITTLILIWVF
jgi:hypothetical protein